MILTTAIASLLLAAAQEGPDLNRAFKMAWYFRDPWIFWEEIPNERRRSVLGSIIRKLDTQEWSTDMARFLMTMIIAPTGFDLGTKEDPHRKSMMPARDFGARHRWKLWTKTHMQKEEMVQVLRWFAAWSDDVEDTTDPNALRVLLLLRRYAQEDPRLSMMGQAFVPYIFAEYTKASLREEYKFRGNRLGEFQPQDRKSPDPIPPPVTVSKAASNREAGAFYMLVAVDLKEFKSSVHARQSPEFMPEVFSSGLSTEAVVYRAEREFELFAKQTDNGSFTVLSAWPVRTS
jgi:hypothetical protein